ncbi:MAG: class I SAM-dependent RNA methyltransferase [Bacteriovoracia bacterium]
MNEILELEIEQMNFGRGGIGNITSPEEVRVFIETPRSRKVEPFAPGDKVRVKVLEKKKGFWTAEVLEILSRNALKRVEPKCEVFGQCGGCQWQHIAYKVQLEQKRKILEAILRQVPKSLPEITIYPCRDPYNYRSRVQIRGNQTGIGFYEGSSNTLVSARNCEILDPRLQKKWKEFVEKADLKELAKKGEFKLEWTLNEKGEILEAFNRKHAAFGFTQVNQSQNEVLRSLVKEWASRQNKKNILLDLYGGDGNLSKQLNGQFKSIICVDISNGGQQISGVSKKLHSEKFRLIECDVREFLDGQYWNDWGSATSAILDPPRIGLENAVTPLLRAGFESLLLVSCHPKALAKDLSFLVTKYEIQKIHLVDMFPQTYHLESVVELKIK